MYGCSKQCLFGVALAFIGLSYFLYIPLCDELEDQWKLRSLLTKFKIIDHVGRLGELVHWDSHGNIRKVLFNYMMSDNKPPEVEGIKTEDYNFDGVPVRLYRPVSAQTPSACVIYIHGGGWTALNVDAFDEVNAELAFRTGYIFVSIEYRLAPEHPFPIPFDDCYRASLHLIKNAHQFGVDAKKIGVSGDSAGGNLAAAVALKMSEVPDIPQLRFQWLLFPALQAFTFQLPSYMSNEDAAPYFLQGEQMAVFWCNYMGVTPTPDVINTILNNRHTSYKLKESKFAKYVDYSQLPPRYHKYMPEKDKSGPTDEKLAQQVEDIILNPFFSPLMKANLSKVAPAFVATAEYDVLRDDGLLYAERMKSDGVDVELYNAPNSTHAFLQVNLVWPRFHQHDVVTEMFIKYAQKHFK